MSDEEDYKDDFEDEVDDGSDGRRKQLATGDGGGGGSAKEAAGDGQVAALRPAHSQPQLPQASSGPGSTLSPFPPVPLVQAQADVPHVPSSQLALGRRIGGGGFAVVHAAVWTPPQGPPLPCAVKVLVDPSPAARAEAEDELHCLTRARGHPHIVHLLAACLEGAKHWMVLELCGTTLAEALHSSSTGAPCTASLAQRLTWAYQATTAVAHLHALTPAVVHRDIKAANVLLGLPSSAGAPPVARLADFGLSTSRVSAAGTPPCMAPELLCGRPHGRPADVFALAILAWECATCAVPHAGRSAAELVRDVPGPAALRPPLSALPQAAAAAGLGPILTRAWAKEASGRQTAAQLAEELAQVCRKVAG